MQKTGFRRDINGLRAIAILTVMLFHFGVPGFSGGFAGVDIFFVISGYLMTNIIFSKVDAQQFSLAGFYADRARRIVPALAALVAVLLAYGYFALIPSDYRLIGKHAAGALTFTSNFLFWMEAGYFDSGARTKWLLHTWSLSVEWQFYILYPLLVLGLSKVASRRGTGYAIVLLAAISIALSVWVASVRPTAGFFLLPPRAWEMLAGGIVCLFPLPRRVSRNWRQALELSGLALILVTVLTFAEGGAWPGWHATLPVAGTMSVIWANRGDSMMTGNSVLSWIGLSSYSTYLWHWPVVVWLNQAGVARDIFWQTAGIAGSFALGWLSYVWIEKRSGAFFRRFEGAGLAARAKEFSTLGAAPAAVFLIGALIYVADGLPRRFSALVAITDAEGRISNPATQGCFANNGPVLPACIIGGNGVDVAVEMIGDSHAAATVSALADAIPAGRGGVRFQAYAACPTVLTVISNKPESQCSDFNREALGTLINGPRSDVPVVVVNNWQGYLDDSIVRFAASAAGAAGPSYPFSIDRFEDELTASVCALASKRRVFLSIPLPEYEVDVPKAMARAFMSDPNPPAITRPLADVRAQNNVVTNILRRVAAQCGAQLLDPLPHMCRDSRCYATEGGRPLYTDSEHLSEFGNRRLVPMYRGVFAS